MRDRSDHGGSLRRRNLKTVVAIVPILLSLGMAGCTTQPSVEAFCSTLEKNKQDFYVSVIDRRAADDLSNYRIDGINDLWSKVAKSAPEEIKPDIEAAAESWKAFQEREDYYTDNAPTGPADITSLENIDRYVMDSCPALTDVYTFRSPPPVPAQAGTQTDSTDVIQLDPENEWTPFGPFMKATNSSDQTVAIFDVPGVGEVTVNLAELLPGLDIWDIDWAYGVDESGGFVAALIGSREEVESGRSHLVSWEALRIDIADGNPRLSQRVLLESRTYGDSYSLSYDEWSIKSFSSANPVVLHQDQGGSAFDGYPNPRIGPFGVSSYGVDFSSGEVSWILPGNPLWAGKEQVYLADLDPRGECRDSQGDKGDTIPARRTVVADADSGAVQEEYSEADEDNCSGPIVDAAGLGDDGRFTVFRHLLSGDTTDEDAEYGYSAISGKAGPEVELPFNVHQVDPLGSIYYPNAESCNSRNGGCGGALPFVDLLDGSTVFSIDNDLKDALDLQVESIFDGVLYVTASGSAGPLDADPTVSDLAIDLKTGQQIGWWEAYPIAQVGEYTFMSDNTLRKDWSFRR